jgi:hypothetical protein
LKDGYEAKDLFRPYESQELHAAGYTATEMKKAKCGARLLKFGGYSAKEAIEAGYTDDELKEGGYTNKELRKAREPTPSETNDGDSPTQIPKQTIIGKIAALTLYSHG